MNPLPLYPSIFQVVSEELHKLGFGPEAIIPHATFNGDLCLDSWDITGIIIKMELHFNISIPLEQFDQNEKTVDDLVTMIEKKLTPEPAAVVEIH